MEDAEYIFLTDAAEKKKIGRGAYNKVRGGGRYVRMPSDSMTREERQSMNGEVTHYNLSKPVTWKEFKAWPDDIQVAYVKGLQKKYDAPAKFVAEMFGVSAGALCAWNKKHNVRFRLRGKDSKLPYDAWNEFLRGGSQPEKEETTETVAQVVEAVAPVVSNAAPVTLQADKNNIATILSLLIGTGAKLTIEVTL